MAALTFSTNATQLIVGGKTFHAKDQFKKLGGKWTGSAWSLPLAADTPENRAFLESAAVLSATLERSDEAGKRAYAKSPAGMAAAAAQNVKYAHGRGWTCCGEAYVMDVTRGHVGCLEHGFFVKGILRTGD
jgi:hypothetical protein